MSITMDQVVSLAKHRGFIFPGSDIYGGLANTWDYGPLGVELKRNVKQLWWNAFIRQSPYNVGLDSAILMNTRTWESSGHLDNFNDPMIDCKECRARHRADKLIEEALEIEAGGLSFSEMQRRIAHHHITCPNCGKANFTDVRHFQLMFKTHQGVTESSANEIYLRPETAQGIFVNFKHVQRTMRKKLPFGIGQIGKSFRNEITPGNFTFRTREFEQMELEFFCEPGKDLEWFSFWRDFCYQWLLALGMKPGSLRIRDHEKDELSHYSDATSDIEYRFPFGWGELWGIADRTDYDLKQHMQGSKEDFHYTDPVTGEQFVPYCIEPSVGVDRVILAFLVDAYEEQTLSEGDTRIVLHLHPALAPYKAAIFPLSKKLSIGAKKVAAELSSYMSVDYDEIGSIGKRYRRHDEIGTPYCITYDFDSEQDQQVTIRDRDTMEQVRLPIDQLRGFLEEKTQVKSKGEGWY